MTPRADNMHGVFHRLNLRAQFHNKLHRFQVSIDNSNFVNKKDDPPPPPHTHTHTSLVLQSYTLGGWELELMLM